MQGSVVKTAHIGKNLVPQRGMVGLPCDFGFDMLASFCGCLILWRSLFDSGGVVSARALS